MRVQNELSKNALAALAHVTPGAVKTMERGDAAVGIEDAVKICRALHCSLEYMLTGEIGLEEYIACNQRFMKLQSPNPEKLRAVARAFWETCPGRN